MTDRQKKRNASTSGDDLLTLAQVADHLQVSVRTVQRYIADGHLHVSKLPSGLVRVRRADVEALLTAGQASA